MAQTIKNSIKSIIGGLGVISAHHYGSKLLDYKNDQEAAKFDELRNNNVLDQLQTINQNIDTVFDNQVTKEKANNILINFQEGINNLQNSLNTEKWSEANKHSDSVKNCMKEIYDLLNSSSNKFTDNINLDSYYEFLNSLSLLEESALVHIFIFLFILLTIMNLVSTLFVNEIIKYFNLENKHPYLNKFFLLRAKFQRYYLIWNFIILTLICLGALFLNILVLW